MEDAAAEDSGVGKSSIANRFVNNTFIPDNESTIGNAQKPRKNYKKLFASQFCILYNKLFQVVIQLMLRTRSVCLQYRSLAPMYYRGAGAAIVAYDITVYNSFESVKSWIRELQVHGPMNIILAIAGNKSDLEEKREVPAAAAQKFAEEIGALFIETSARTATNVEQLFIDICTIWIIDKRNIRTISRRLVANGLHSCRPLRRLPLTPPNRRQRLEWCRARSTWMSEWHRVVFSDESRFCLSSDSRRVRVWRRRGERSNPAAIEERPTVRQRGIMVWGAIAYDSRSPLLRIQGTMTAQRYVDDVLRPVTLPYLQGVPNALYQQDNARPHTARISQQALQDVQMLPWPPYSPELSPIEHVWDIIGRRLHALPQPRLLRSRFG
ncbi:hypothetical protein LAZ67_17001972 [Cordylochernes scorpioides]|uniref:Uncharacterized protein n=1 Tax=Cordylochernes scorpioides TaxID=51811 RepID=A0ABY6LGJ3_9ARAC|nr:hypothetical protein LAZ67_17001972 [Cordylochernes scorpioides]